MPPARVLVAAIGLAVLPLLLCPAPARGEVPGVPRLAPDPRFQDLQTAVNNGDVEAVRRLLDAGVSAKGDESSRLVPILAAAWSGKPDVVQLLLDRGADPNTFLFPKDFSDSPQTLVTLAALRGHVEAVCVLAKGGGRLSAPAAVAVGDVARLRELVGRDRGLLTKRWYFDPRNSMCTLIDLATWFYSAGVITALVDLGADPKADDSYGRTPLLWAASEGRLGAVRELLKYDNRVNYAGASGLSPLSGAAFNQHEDVVKLLLAAPGAEYDVHTAAARGDLARVKELVEKDPARVSKTVTAYKSIYDTIYAATPLVWAARFNRRAVVEYLLEAGSDMDGHGTACNMALANAAGEGYVEIVKLLLDRGADIEAGAGHDGTPLHQAASDGRTEVAALLLDRGAQVDAGTEHNDTALEWAANNGHVAMAKLLLDRGAKVDGGLCHPLGSAISYGYKDLADLLLDRGASMDVGSGIGSIIHATIRQADPDMVAVLVKHKVDPSAKDGQDRTALQLAAELTGPACRDKYRRIFDLLLAGGFGLEARGRGGYTALHAAIGGHGDASDVAYVLDCGADIKAATDDGDTALHLACRRRDPEIVKLLLARGADLGAVNKAGRTPIYGALPADDEKSKALVALLLERKAELDVFAETQLDQTDKVLACLAADPKRVTATDGRQTLLHIAAARGNLKLVQALVEKGADLEAEGWSKFTPLHAAASAGHTEVVKVLIGRGANVHAEGEGNQSILYSAALGGHADIVRLLLAAKADSNAATKGYDFPLAAAARNGSAPTVKALLDSGININRVIFSGPTALEEAVRGGHEEVVRLLIERGARLDGKTGGTLFPPLHLAVMGRSEAILRMILKAGEPVNRVRDQSEETALDWALDSGRDEMAKILREAGGVQAHEIAGPERVEALVKRLGDPDYQVRQVADKALRVIVYKATDLLREALRKTDDPEVRVRLKKILGPMAPSENKP
jgi:ankyrin repeat protein